MIEILNVPSLLTVQDAGRKGYRKLGVPVSGFMDDYSARIANYLVGNPGNAPLLEFFLSGPTIRFDASTVFAVVGEVDVELNGITIEPWRSYWAKRGDILKVRTLSSGVYGYIAFAGGIKCERILGSCSTYQKAGLGRPLKAGDRLSLGYSLLTGKDNKALPRELRPNYSGNQKAIRIILGPDLDHFTEEGIETFLTEAYTVTPESDRMGYRLDGRPIKHSEKGGGIVTGPLVPGSVQVPANGKPIIMLRDAQTTGGYARIGVVATVDLATVAQSRPGQRLKFGALSVDDARKLLIRREKTLEAIRDFLDGKLRAYRVRALEEEFITFSGLAEGKD